MRNSIVALALLCSTSFALADEAKYSLYAYATVKKDHVVFKYKHEPFDSVKDCMAALSDPKVQMSNEAIIAAAKNIDKDATVEFKCDVDDDQ